MINYQFTVVIEHDEDQFHAFVPSLPGCHSFGSSVDEARTHIAEAIELYIEGLIEDGEVVPVEREPVYVTHLSVALPA